MPTSLLPLRLYLSLWFVFGCINELISISPPAMSIYFLFIVQKFIYIPADRFFEM